MFHWLANLLTRTTVSRSLKDDLARIAHEHSAHLLGSATFDAAELVTQYPPQIEHAKKQLLFDLGLANGVQGPLTVLRYDAIPLPVIYEPYSPVTEIVARKGYFRYSMNDPSDDWYMNFAHHDLFHGYGHFMFAQDEIQVAEHPVLASIREMMVSRTDRLRPLSVENGSPTPVLVRGVQRTLNIDTRSIYGARFARAENATIRESATAIEPPTRSNILAIEAPIPTGNRIYSRPEIELAIHTAYSGMRAVVLASRSDPSSRQPIVIHTGNWGCGAYGGNRQLMLSVQMMAARLAGISQVVFYCGADSKEDVAAFDHKLIRQFKFRPGEKVNRVVDRLVAAAFPWGTPDGN